MSQIELSECEFLSTSLDNSRKIWFQEPRSAEPSWVCVFLDAEYYIERLSAPEIVDDLQARGRIPSLLVAYASHIDHATRWPESFCNPKFDRFIVDELLPWIVEKFELSASIHAMIAGLSLTGLSAAHAALASRNRISRALCQSASFWWDQGWIRENLGNHPPSDVAFRISVGSDEATERVDHGDGLIQEESQLVSNRRMRDALLARGHRVSYCEFSGGHDLAAWRADLPASLTAVFEV